MLFYQLVPLLTQPLRRLSVVFYLQDKQDNITNSACQEEVFYYQLMEVTDFRNDVILAEACRQDVEKYCKDVEPGALTLLLTNCVCHGQ